MYRPTFDSHKRFWLRTITDLVERVNAKTPWVAGLTVDEDETVLHVTASKNRVTKRDVTIRLTAVEPLTTYIADREFRHQRQTEMKELSRYLTEIIEAEQTRTQHTQLDRAYKHQLKTIQPLAKALSQQGKYVATVNTPKGHDPLTLSIHPIGSTGSDPLIHQVVALAPDVHLSDTQALAAKQHRNERLADIAELLTQLTAATQAVANKPA